MQRRAVALGVALGVALVAQQVRADSGRDARVLRDGWSRGGRASALPTLFLERDESISLGVPPAGGPWRYDCVSVAALGSVQSSFTLRLQSGEQVPSVAGLIEISRCGSARDALRGARFVMRSPRGMVERVVAWSDAPLARAVELLPERDAIDAASTSGTPRAAEVGARLRALSERLSEAEQRARREGAVSVGRTVFQIEDGGVGEGAVDLEAGCHELRLMAEAISSDQRIDADLELLERPHQALVSERSASPDAALVLCTAEAESVRLRYGGTAPTAELTLFRARFPLPSALPLRWPARVRAATAALLGPRRSRQLGRAPAWQRRGGLGRTRLRAPVRPGQCYWFSVVPVAGTLSGLRVELDGDERLSSDSFVSGVGSAISWCASREHEVDLIVSAFGESLTWQAALFRVSARPLGGEGSR